MMEPNPGNNALLHLNIRLAAAPALTLVKTSGVPQSIPAGNNPADGFVLEADAAFSYEGLSNALDTYLQGKRFTLSEGLIHQYVIIDGCRLYSNLRDGLVVEARFTGSFKGTVYITGRPVYDPVSQKITLQQFDYDLKTNNLLLRGAKWLFDKVILEEMRKYTVVDVALLYKTASAKLNEVLNKDWTTGVRTTGTAEQFELTGIDAQQHQLHVHLKCSGTLHITLSEMNFKL